MRIAGSKNRSTPARRLAAVEAAIELFAERGVANTTMAEIAEAAGLSRGSLYHHFSGREEMFAAAFVQAVSGAEGGGRSITEAIESTLEGFGLRFGVEEAVLRLVRGYLDWHQREPARGKIVRLGLFDTQLAPFVDAGLAAQRRLVMTVLERFIPYRKGGSVLEMSDEVLVALILGPVRDFVGSWYKLPGEEQARAMSAARQVLPRSIWRSISPSAEARP